MNTRSRDRPLHDAVHCELTARIHLLTGPLPSFVSLVGGLEDLRGRVLRSPYPSNRPAAEVFAEVLRSSDEQALA